MKRIVVKIGSNVLTRPDRTVDVTRVSSIVDQVVSLKRLGYEVVMVSSGSVASGRTELTVIRDLDGAEQRQLFSAVGQVRLMGLYYRFFKDYGLNIGQVLTMRRDFETSESRDNLLACLSVMLEMGVVPIINENDTVSLNGLMFNDNDELAGLIAGLVSAQAMVILTNVDGIFNGSPDDPSSSVIRTVRPEDDLSGCISTRKSPSGRGGMYSKYISARQCAAKGIRVIIANGKKENILTDLASGSPEAVCTEFLTE